MVNFESDATLGTNRSHILDLIVLGRRDEWLNTYQKYSIALLDNKSGSNELFNVLKSILLTMSIELKETMLRKWTNDEKPDYNEFLTKIRKANNDQEIISCFDALNQLLDGLNMTKIDTKRYFDTTSVETENQEKGL